ncbi:MAG TPA: DUF2568 domain-containing protein [Candidatus Limnocylindrales bacterium]|jgi:hypothetical protein
MAIANLTIRFIVELLGIAAFGYWALQAGGPIAAVAAVAVAVVVWAVVVAPKARNPLTQPQRDIVGTSILLLASGALVAAGQPALGIALAVIVMLNAIVLRALGPGARDAFTAPAGRPR